MDAVVLVRLMEKHRESWGYDYTTYYRDVYLYTLLLHWSNREDQIGSHWTNGYL